MAILFLKAKKIKLSIKVLLSFFFYIKKLHNKVTVTFIPLGVKKKREHAKSVFFHLLYYFK
jgi:hypothetical protein